MICRSKKGIDIYYNILFIRVPHDLPHDLRHRIVGNKETSGKSQNWVETQLVPSPLWKNELLSIPAKNYAKADVKVLNLAQFLGVFFKLFLSKVVQELIFRPHFLYIFFIKTPFLSTRLYLLPKSFSNKYFFFHA